MIRIAVRTFRSLALAFLPLMASSADSIWVEAENAAMQDVISNGWYNSVRKADLSGGAWISHFGKSREGSASYASKVSRTATYTLWIRANPVKTILEVRINGGAWKKVPTGRAASDQRNVSADGKPDLRFVAWSKFGEMKLSAGPLKVDFRMRSQNANHGAIDCFCFTSDSTWKPSGILKPGQAKPHWPAPEVNDESLDQWLAFLRPSKDELGWRNIRWHRSLEAAAIEARKLDRPILLWTMNGHPCGET